jgi:uncharacterized Tic20 family protein
MLTILIYLVIIGVALYLVNSMVPMDGRIKMIINIVVVLATCIWLLEAFGLVNMGSVPRYHGR